MPADLHPHIGPLAALLGTWRGRGRGEYPTIEPFTFEEETVFDHVGKPFLSYRQRTWAEDGSPLHAEVGYLRALADGSVELVVAHPFGAAEIATGSVDATGPLTIDLATVDVATTPSAKPVEAVVRRMVVTGDLLTYEVGMAAVGVESAPHLVAELRRAI